MGLILTLLTPEVSLSHTRSGTVRSMLPFQRAAKSALFCSALRGSRGIGILEPGKMIFAMAVPACVLLLQSGECIHALPIVSHSF